MGALIAIVVIVITYIAFVDGGYHDSQNTVNSKNISRQNGLLTYDQYSKGGRAKTKRLVSNNQKVFVDPNGDVKNMRGQKNMNKYDEQDRMGQEIVKNYCLSKGYDFYPYFKCYKRKNECIYVNDTVICIDARNGKKFVFGCLTDRFGKPYRGGELYNCRRAYEETGYSYIKSEGIYPEKKYPVNMKDEMFNLWLRTAGEVNN